MHNNEDDKIVNVTIRTVGWFANVAGRRQEKRDKRCQGVLSECSDCVREKRDDRQ